MIVRKGERLGSILHDTEDEPGPEPSPETDPYESETVVSLRQMLSDRELSTSGNKAELVERLHEADNAADDEADDDDSEEDDDGDDDAS